jgi:hypothetical protein
VRGVVCRTDDDKIVIHDVAAVDAEPGGYELIFQRTRMRQNHVDVAGFSQFECLACAYGDDVDLAVTLLLEGRKQHIKDARSLCRSGGR